MSLAADTFRVDHLQLALISLIVRARYDFGQDPDGGAEGSYLDDGIFLRMLSSAHCMQTLCAMPWL